MKKIIFVIFLMTIAMTACSQTSQLEQYNGWILQSAIRVVNVGGLENGIMDQSPANSPIKVIHIIQGDFIYQIMIARNEDVAPYNIGLFTVERLNNFMASNEQILLSD